MDFPSAPTVGQTYNAPNGVLYTWDGAAWTTKGVLPTIVYTQSWTAQGADLATLTPVPVAGAYRLNYILLCEVAAAGAGTVVLHAYADFGGSDHFISTAVPLTTTAGSIASGSWPMNCSAAGVHFYVDHTGTYSTAKWGMSMSMERLA